MNNEAEYEYKFWETNLGDGGFNKGVDEPLAKLLADGWKPLREVLIGDGWVLFVLSRKKKSA